MAYGELSNYNVWMTPTAAHAESVHSIGPRL